MCQVDYYNSDWVELGQTYPRARSRHRCGDCRRVIQPGECYRRIRGISTGDPVTVKQCAHCEAAGEWLMAICGGYLYSRIGEDLTEHWHEEWDLRCRTLALLIAGHRRRWEGMTPRKVATLTRYAIRHAKRQIERAREWKMVMA